MSTDAKHKLSEEELLAQTTVLTIAGHDTTANTLSWVLYELAQHPIAQTKLRDEVKAFRVSHGDRDIHAGDFDVSFPYTTATLRFLPIVIHLLRKASNDDTIPLSKPLKTRHGKEISSISVKRGQVVLTSLWGYNRLEEIWGNDPDIWRPERFLTKGESTKHSVGVYGNLASFSSGVHSCIGWRFAIIELHSILITLIERFEFLPAPDVTVLPVPAGTVMPMVKGEEDKGPQVPITIRSL
ncbi:hypothetical protein M422DRAFT_264873 [Sphaerobolus stellatus SS14]|uniref:Cytochrome P450 n=1 Tax=Sphaerobolus stellatus (strain SS14) TaxID=990650 RepID=A0A0C9V6S4_SPHS4|nr:hypothetical protein M422DRAFT_264873 [Sphaerobolus stellatus SS14]